MIGLVAMSKPVVYDRIVSFHGEFDFLSNFHPAVVYVDNVKYLTLEHGYQASKTLSRGERAIIARAITPGEAKNMGQSVTKRPDWEQIKLTVMADLLAQKFAPGSALAAKLLATGNAELIEGNYWRDTFWGVCRGVGENHLGRLLMERRQKLRSMKTRAPRIRTSLRLVNSK